MCSDPYRDLGPRPVLGRRAHPYATHLAFPTIPTGAPVRSRLRVHVVTGPEPVHLSSPDSPP